MLLLTLVAFRNVYLGRGLAVWGVLRLTLAYYGHLWNPGVLVEGGLLGAVALAVALDAHRRGEDLFLANLGIPLSAIAFCSLPAAFVAECLVP